MRGDWETAVDAEGSRKGGRRLGDGEGSGRTAENETERIRILKKKMNLTKHSQTLDLGDFRARARSKTLIYILCCAVAQIHYFLLIYSNLAPIGRITIILSY